MTNRTVRVRVAADLAGYVPAMTRATGQTVVFGRAAVTAGRGVRVLGADAAAARAGLIAAGAGARTGAAGVRAAEAASLAAGRGVRGMGVAAAGTAPVFGRIGTAARSGFGSVRAGAASALRSIRSIGLLLAGGTIIYGLHHIVEQGNEYTNSMYKFLEVTRASGAQMAAAAREAQALGADMKLPSANAAEAADAMVDLAKAGLGASDAIKSARGTIQLSAAARTDVATAARIEGDIMDQFALKSTQATHVADVLANTSNSASGELMDLYYAMKYLGPTAHSLGVSVDEAATAVGLLGKSGIIGETAGTSLRGALVNLAKQTPQMKKGLKSLGIQAFDSQGRFKGLEYVIDTLHDAQERLTQQQFTAAAAMAFGKPALSAMTALAHQGGESFRNFGQQVSRAGGAAAIAAAESKGLGGAMRGLGKQLSSTFLQVYLGIAPSLEKITRGMTSSVSSAIPYIKRGVRTAGDLWTLYGPAVEAKLHAAEGAIGRAAASTLNAAKKALARGVVIALPVAISGGQTIDKALQNAAGATPELASGFRDVASSVGSASGALGVLAGRTQVAVGWLGDLTGLLGPIAHIVGDVAHAFAGLPGPIQLSVLSMLALRPFRSQITAMQASVVGFGRRGVNAFRSLGNEVRLQQTLARGAGLQLTRMGGAVAALQARSRTFNAMGTAFRTTSASIQTSGGRLSAFRGQVTGVQNTVGEFGRRGVASFRSLGNEVRLQQTLARGAGVELGRMGGAVAALQTRIRGAGAFRSLGDEMRLQQTLARGAGVQLTRMGGAVAALQTRVQVAGARVSAFRGQVTGMQASVIGFGRRGVASFRTFGDEVRLQQTLARGAGVELTRMGGTFAALRSRVQVAGARMSSFRGIVGGTAAALGVGAGRGLLGAGRGLVNFLGGPWGLAFGAAMIGLDLWAKHQQKAAEQVRQTQQRVSALTDALKDSSGVVNTNVREIAAQNLMQQKSTESGKHLLEVARQAKVPLSALVDAYTGQGSSLADLRKKLDAAAASQSSILTYQGSGGIKKTTFYLTDQAAASAELSGQMKGLSGDYKTAVQNAQDYQNAVAAGQDPTSRLSQAIDTLAQSSADADTKARALHEALDLLSGGELDVQAAVADMNQAVTDLNGTWDEGVDHAKGYKDQLLQVDGSLNTTTENGQQLWNKLQSLNEATANASQATYDYARANNEGVVPALEQAEARMQTAWQTAVTAAQKFGMTKDQAELLAAQMGFIPSNLAITLSTPGLDQTSKDLLYVQGLAGHLPKDAKVRVTALTAEAVKDIESLGFKVHMLPGGRQMEITAPTAKAARELDALIAKRIPAKKAEVDAVTAQAWRDLAAFEAKLKGVPPGKTIIVSAPSGPVIQELRDIGFKVTTLPGKKVQVALPTGPVKSAVDLIKQYLATVQDKHITLTTENRTIYTGKGGRGPNASADGNIFTPYAAGGMRERHTAQIAPGGAMRLWAEPETGGEAYIPLAPGKRGRSTAILRQVADQFGYDLQHYAQGGITAFAAGGLADGFSYAPPDPVSTLGTGGAMDRYTTSVQRLRDAWDKLNAALADQKTKTKAVQDAEKNLNAVRGGKHTAKQLAAAEKKLNDARAASSKANSAVVADRKAVNAADSYLGLKGGAKAPAGFDLAAYGKQLALAAAANRRWESGLANVGKRAGTDVEQTLRDMGADGEALVYALSHASGKAFTDIVNNLKSLAPTAKATLADYTNQLKSAASSSKSFQDNLLKLASMGYGDLAAQLAAQGDDNAAAVAAAAVKSPSGAASAAAAATAAAGLLSGDDLTSALTLLGVLRAKPGRGISDVISAGLDWATIQRLVPKLTKQLASLPKADTATFLAQYAGQGSGGVAMARGGILPDSSYTVLAGERGTGGEAYIPLGAGNRNRSTALLRQVAGQFGYHLMPVGRSTGAPVVQHHTRHNELHLHGGGQSQAEQHADLLRQMAFIN